jgi:hypothetical protein
MLPALAGSCLPFNEYFGEQRTKEILELFDKFEQVGRYGAAAKYDPLARKEEGIETKGVMVWHVQYVLLLDEFVYKVRSMLNFNKKPGMDTLRRILSGDKNSPLETGWKGPPLIQVLTASNNYFKTPTG